MCEPRFYREEISPKGLYSFRVVVDETDLYVSATQNLARKTLKSVLKYRGEIEEFIAREPLFKETFKPYEVLKSSPAIVKNMAEAAKIAGVGPMAAVAGAIAEHVGKDLLKYTKEVIVENGGDIFIKTENLRKMGIYAGDSSLSEKVAIIISPQKTPLGVCTSSGTVGPSVSLGSADAVVVLSKDTSLADASATAIGNLVKGKGDIKKALVFGKSIVGVEGIIIIKDDKMGVWGEVELKRTD